MRFFLASLCLLFFAFNAFSQTSDQKVKVFLDCTQEWLCDFDYVRTELKAVTFVRDRFASDVHVQVNTQNNSSGGIQAEVIFLGQNVYSGVTDTLRYFNPPASTEDEQRRKLVQYLKIGLLRYLSKTNLADHIEINIKGVDQLKDSASATKKDPWNYWVYQFGGSASFNGNANTKSNSFYGYINANQETEKWKINMNLSLDRSNQTFKQNNEELHFDQKNYNAGVSVARAINEHWSYGLSSAYQNSLFRNIRTGIIIRPKLEYSLFPYKRFNNERIVFQYMVGPVYNNYYDTTIFFKTDEFQVQQSLNMITSINKPWGNINIGVFWSNYFDDLSKNNLSFNGAVNWKIAKGLNFGLYGYYGLIQDQITVRKGEATREQLLTNNRELLSSYEFNLGFGFSYRFGSVNNSIVNPRFKGLNYSVSF